MYIAPNTIIRILHNVPLDNTYEHTLYFDSTSAQANYFSGKTLYLFNAQSYQRVNKGVIRLRRKADDLYNANYLMFRNTNYGNKWFYAFIQSVEFVNNEVSEVTFEIDVMQTWFFDYNLKQCYVEREHTSTDNMFEHIEEENLNVGDEVVCNAIEDIDLSTMSLCVLYTKTPNEQNYHGKVINGVYTPLRVNAGVSVRSADENNLNAVINDIVSDGQEDRIVAVYQYPSVLGDASTQTPYSANKNITVNNTTLDNYTPRNNKLYNYPYNFMIVSNNEGQTAIYRYESWDDISANNTVSFYVKGVFVPTPCILLYPYRYRGIVNDYDSGLTMADFPQCAWVGDAFTKWWAENKNTVVTSGIASVLGSALTMGAMAVNPAVGVSSALGQIGIASAGLSTASGIASTIAKTSDLKNTPPQIHGQTQTNSLNAGIGRVMYRFYKMSIKRHYAKIIDDYFTRYGYAVKRTKVPNRAVRPHWTYTKTLGCTISGNVPCDDLKKICSIYDNGITFWKKGDEVGDYTLNNAPV